MQGVDALHLCVNALHFANKCDRKYAVNVHIYSRRRIFLAVLFSWQQTTVCRYGDKPVMSEFGGSTEMQHLAQMNNNWGPDVARPDSYGPNNRGGHCNT